MSRYITFLAIYFAIICVDNVISDSVKITKESNDFVTIKTPKAQVHGKVLKSRLGNDILAFRGIRYAEPPIGERRFQPPVPRTELIGNVNATVDGWICPQSQYQLSMVNEDCLILNVYTKRNFNNTPVLVYIHGGTFISGSSHSQEDIGPQYFLDKDVVFVTLNYRLNSFGFLTTGDKNAPGNAGFKDQVAALRWVQKNIKYFGGDPNSVTIAGESAGSMSVSLHLLSPMSRGLFHKAIMLSGAITGQHTRLSREWTQKLAKSINCPTTNSTALVKCLQHVSTKTLIDKTKFLISLSDVGLCWSYDLEEDYGQERFMIENPTKLLVEGRFHKVPIIMSLTKDELDLMTGVISKVPFSEAIIAINFANMAPHLLQFSSQPNSSAIATTLKPLYFGNPLLRQSGRTFNNLASDNYIRYGVHSFAKYTKSLTSPLYFFVLNYADNIEQRVHHADDLKYIFPSAKDPLISLNDNRNFLVERYTTWFSNFAKYSDPNMQQNQYTFNCNLAQSSSTKIIATYVDKTCYIGDEPYLDRFNVWDSAFPIIPS